MNYKYLQKCNDKLRRKVFQDKYIINKLCRINTKMKADKKDEVERIRCFYDAIAFGLSRAGKMVCTARGTSLTISQKMKEIYSASQDHSYN